MDVRQDDYVVDCGDLMVETTGLGPCVGVAIVYKNKVSLIHTTDPYVAPDFGMFCDEVGGIIPESERASILPIVAGGEAKEFPKQAARNRAHVIAKLLDMGLGAPQIRWCPDDHVQTLHVDNRGRTATLVEWNYVVGSQPSLERLQY